MYHEFYGLTRMPFQGAPDPDFLYPGPTHREALATLE
ncbi:MAG: ATPase, partial [Proteobacteria bacterium]|nr:ATPase [Pseudomonadota bacterium]